MRSVSPFDDGNRGALVYVEVPGNLDAHVARVEAEGGRVVLPRTDLGAFGELAIVVDADGNAVGLHSPRP
jgi:predicted enzyme related to lactoylglutathione lyase